MFSYFTFCKRERRRKTPCSCGHSFLFELMKGVLANQNVDVSYCISDSTVGGIEYVRIIQRLHSFSGKRIFRSYSHMVLCSRCQFDAL